MDKNLIKKIKMDITNLKKNYGIKKIGVFGSYARGEETRESDVDILVEFHETPDLFKFFSLEEYLEKLLNKKIDMVRPQGLKAKIKDNVLSEVIYL